MTTTKLPELTTQPAAEQQTTAVEREVAEGCYYFLTSFGAKRFANKVQEEACELLIVVHGLEKFKQGVQWAAKLGMPRGKAIVALEKALPKWGRPRDSVARHLRQDDESRERYNDWNR
jgi:hypothetical protein